MESSTEPAQIKLFNTDGRKLEDFTPINPGKVGVYVCGPTVYNYQHIGNLKAYICHDLLIRTLRLAGYEVDHVMNITDVGHLTGDDDAEDGEDKMLVAAKREKKKSHEIAEYYTGKFFDDWNKLRLSEPTTVCKATEHIQEMIELIQRIEANGLAYQAGGNVYFDVDKFEKYGKMAKLDLANLQAGARIDVDNHKKNPLDFALWFTKSKFEDQELQWDSPWGRGYPGWHIECSAMSIKYLGEQFDIHCGGIDHIPVHHTNEIAQSEAATQKPWVNYWVHSDFILLNNERMAKSAGGFIVLDNLIDDGFSPEVYKLFVMSAHYRSQINFSKESLETAKQNYNKLKEGVLQLKESGAAPSELGEEADNLFDEFKAALFNDINMPQAVAVLWKVLGSSITDGEKLAVLYRMDQVFALGLKELEREEVEIPAEIADLLSKREDARNNKEWALSDQLRDQIEDAGFKVIDSSDGQRVEKL